ncbi:MAG: flagellar hook-length control protein FliK [Gammaproteobacteria bacterium]|nr:flagellar hook-length control protein FliK [Gammaproteobacteria bacterium]
MYIDKSFQLLSADSSKQASDETRRQSAGDDDAEFSEFFGAELDSQEQRRTAGNDKAGVSKDKKSGQEFAASLAKPDTPSESKATKAIDQAQSGKADLDVKSTADETEHIDENAIELVTALLEQPQSDANESSATETEGELEVDGAASPNPWLSIISQSLDFNSMLSQSSANGAAVATVAGDKLTSTETLVAEALGLSAKEQSNTEILSSETPLQLSQTELAKQAEALELQLLKGQNSVGNEQNKKTLTDAALLLIANEQPEESSQAAKAAKTEAGSDEKLSEKPGKLTAEQVSVQDLLKTDKSQQQATVEGDLQSEPKVAETKASKQPDIQDTGTLAATVTAPSAAGQSPAIAVPADVIASQFNQAQSNEEKSTAALLGDLEDLTVVSPDLKAQSTLITNQPTTTDGTTPAKNAPQSFAQFQKAANAAAALMQKQQLQAEQTQSQPPQELAAQQPQKISELNPLLPGQHSDSQIVLTTLAQTERQVASNPGSSASSGGQQQHQAASQLFAARLNEQTNREQPALNLLEPNAASQLKERVMFQVNQKIHTAEIKLAPEELGNMQIKVQLQQEQLSVQFVVQQAGAKEALEQQMPRLREMLQEQGIELTEGQVSQQREGSDGQRQAQERNHGVGHGADVDEEPLLQQAMIKVSDRMVDYYA